LELLAELIAWSKKRPGGVEAGAGVRISGAAKAVGLR